MSNVSKGFILSEVGQTKVSDVELLALPISTITMMLNNRTAFEYLVWKRQVLRKVLNERVDSNDYGADAQSRINFTVKAIAHVEWQIDMFETEEG